MLPGTLYVDGINSPVPVLDAHGAGQIWDVTINLDQVSSATKQSIPALVRFFRSRHSAKLHDRMRTPDRALLSADAPVEFSHPHIKDRRATLLHVKYMHRPFLELPWIFLTKSSGRVWAQDLSDYVYFHGIRWIDNSRMLGSIEYILDDRLVPLIAVEARERERVSNCLRGTPRLEHVDFSSPVIVRVDVSGIERKVGSDSRIERYHIPLRTIQPKAEWL